MRGAKIYTTKEYEDKSDLPNAMQYDSNGNLTKDNDRQIDTIYYNLLNLPEKIHFANGNRTEYQYSADGQKQRAYYHTMAEPLLIGDDSIVGQHMAEEMEIWYSGNREKYRVRGLDSMWQWYKEIVYNDEGYTEFALNDTIVTDMQQYYYRKDHVGNIVAVWNATKEETPQRTFYYASGLPMRISTGLDLQARKYGGKEFDEMHGLNEYNSEARHYYPAICRTTTIEPLCEKYYSASPYVWCGNDYVNRIEQSGIRRVMVQTMRQLARGRTKSGEQMVRRWGIRSFWIRTIAAAAKAKRRRRRYHLPETEKRI